MKFAAIINYANQQQIAEVRPAHREYIARLHAAGRIVVSGPFEDDSGALIVYEAGSREDAEGMIVADPFHAAGVFASWDLRPWRQTI